MQFMANEKHAARIFELSKQDKQVKLSGHQVSLEDLRRV